MVATGRSVIVERTPGSRPRPDWWWRDEPGRRRDEPGRRRDELGRRRDELGRRRDEPGRRRDEPGRRRDELGRGRQPAGSQRLLVQLAQVVAGAGARVAAM